MTNRGIERLYLTGVGMNFSLRVHDKSMANGIVGATLAVARPAVVQESEDDHKGRPYGPPKTLLALDAAVEPYHNSAVADALGIS